MRGRYSTELLSRTKLLRVVGFALLAVFLYALYRFSIGVVLPEIAAEFHLSDLQKGLLLSLPLAATTLTVGIAGYLADKVGEKIVLVTGVLLYSVGLLLSLRTPDYVLVLAFLSVNGLGSGIMLPPLYSLVGVLLPKARGMGIGVVSAVYNVGGFVGPALSSQLATPYGWRFPLLIMSAVGFGSAALQWLGIDVPKRDASHDPTRGGTRRSLLRDRNIVIISVAMLLADVGFLAFISWAPTFMRTILGMGIGETGFYFGAAIAFGGVGVLAFGYLFDRVGGKKAALLGGTASTILTLLFFLQTEAGPEAILLLLATSFMTNTFWSLLSALAQVTVDDRLIGTATGIVQNAGFLGAIIGPTIVGVVVSGVGLGLALIVSVTLPYVAYTLVMLGYRTKPARA